MIFFIVAASVMAMLIVSIHKLAGRFGCELPLSSLVLCGVCAIVINFVIISVTPFLTSSYYYTTGAMILFAAFGTTCYNKYLLHRKIHLALGGLLSRGEAEAGLLIKADTAGHSAEAEPKAGTTTATENAIANAISMAETKARAAEEAAVYEEPAQADSITSVHDEVEQADSVTAVHDEAEQADSVTAVHEDAEQTDSVTTAHEETAQADSVTAVHEEAEPADSMTAVHDEAEQADSVTAVYEEAEQADSVTAAHEEAELADSMTAVHDEAEQADSVTAAYEEAEQTDDITAVHEEAEQADGVTAVHEETAQADGVTAIHEEAEQEPAESADDIREEAASDRDVTDALSAMTTMDQLLDFAFEQNLQKRPQVALAAYQTALERYRGDSYAPFIVVSIANIHKEHGNYDAAIDSIRRAMDIPAMLESSSIKRQFDDTLSYLMITRNVLQTAGLGNISFKEIPKKYMSQIESIYNSRKSR